MCLILLAFNAHPRYRLVIAANRDEFYARPTAPAEFWEDTPLVLGGRDLTYGGTWLGVTKNGRFAAVTNYREPNVIAGTKTRGDLTRRFLEGPGTAKSYLAQIEGEQNDYSGFSLLIGEFCEDRNELSYFSNRDGGTRTLPDGVYGLSNALLNTRWPKVEAGTARFIQVVGRRDRITEADLFPILADRTVAADHKLPATGIGIERERVLSPIFIETEGYGTRSSTVLLVDKSGRVSFVEKTFGDLPGVRRYEFSIDE